MTIDICLPFQRYSFTCNSIMPTLQDFKTFRPGIYLVIYSIGKNVNTKILHAFPGEGAWG